MSSVKEIARELDRTSEREYQLSVLMQDLVDFDALMRTEYGHGYGRVQDWVFAKLAMPQLDRGLYIRMMECLDLAISEGAESLGKLGILVENQGRPVLVYSERKSVTSMMVGEVDDLNVIYWIRLPSTSAKSEDDERVVYKVGKRGVDGLLEYLGLGCYAASEKFNAIDNFRHWIESLVLDSHTTFWWVDSDRRSFVRVETMPDGLEMKSTHYFQLGGGYWGSRKISFEEAAELGESKGRKIDPDQLRIAELV